MLTSQTKLRLTSPTHILGMPHLSPRHNEPIPVCWNTGHTPIWMEKTLRLMAFLNPFMARFLELFFICHTRYITSYLCSGAQKSLATVIYGIALVMLNNILEFGFLATNHNHMNIIIILTICKNACKQLKF